jgi:hypothetical protein
VGQTVVVPISVQGSAADIVKVAMLNVFKRIRDGRAGKQDVVAGARRTGQGDVLDIFSFIDILTPCQDLPA